MIARLLLITLALLALPLRVDAQTAEAPRPFAWDVARAVLIDPTTYAPAIIFHKAISDDWKTSQVLFAHGWLEANPRFTRSGLPNDAPLSYEKGKGVIARDSLKMLGTSALHNGIVGIGERLLIQRYPQRRKLIRTMSWIERIGFASILTYRNAAVHLRQSDENRRLARAYGYVR
jgi:hypothetical protein